MGPLDIVAVRVARKVRTGDRVEAAARVVEEGDVARGGDGLDLR